MNAPIKVVTRTNNTERANVILLGRVSTSMQDTNGDSIRNQHRIVEEGIHKVLCGQYSIYCKKVQYIGTARVVEPLEKTLKNIKFSKTSKLNILAVKDVSRLSRMEPEKVINLTNILSKYMYTHVYIHSLKTLYKVNELVHDDKFLQKLSEARSESNAIRDRIRMIAKSSPRVFEQIATNSRTGEQVRIINTCLLALCRAIYYAVKEQDENGDSFTVGVLEKAFSLAGIEMQYDEEDKDNNLSDMSYSLSQLVRDLNQFEMTVNGKSIHRSISKIWTIQKVKTWARHYERYMSEPHFVKPAPIVVEKESNELRIYRKDTVESRGGKRKWVTFYYDGNIDNLPPDWNRDPPQQTGYVSYWSNENQ